MVVRVNHCREPVRVLFGTKASIIGSIIHVATIAALVYIIIQFQALELTSVPIDTFSGLETQIERNVSNIDSLRGAQDRKLVNILHNQTSKWYIAKLGISIALQ